MSHRTLTAGLSAVMTLVAFAYMAIATAMPLVARELDGLALYGLAFSSAMAGGVIGTVTGGWWADARGPSAPLWTGMTGFVAGLLIAGLATSMEALIAGRVVQGFGGALVGVALYVVVARVYPEDDRPKIFSLLATAWVLPSLAGPVVVGIVVDTVGWRWVFLSVPALMTVAAPALLRGLAGHPVSGGQAAAAPGLLRKAGWAALTAAGAVLTQYGSTAGPLILVTGLIVLAAALPRLLPRGTLRATAGLPAVVALRGLTTGAFYAAEVMVPLMLVAERGLPAATAGIALTGGALTWALGSWLQGRQAFARTANLRVGTVLVAVGIALTASVTMEAVPVAVAYLSWLVGGFGIGLVYPTLSVVTLELSGPGEQGTNTSSLQVGEAVFSVVAIAVTSAMFTATGSGYALAFAAAVLIALAAAWVAIVRPLSREKSAPMTR